MVTFICFCAITLCNIKIRLFVRSHNRRITEESDQLADVARARNIKLGRLVAYMSLSYVTVYCIACSTSRHYEYNRNVRRIFMILFIMYQTNNFIIFAVGDKRCRNEVKKMVSGCFDAKDPLINRLKLRTHITITYNVHCCSKTKILTILMILAYHEQKNVVKKCSEEMFCAYHNWNIIRKK